MKQKSFHEHFLKDDHHGSEEDISISLIDKTDPHKVEYYWARAFTTIAPFGHNAKEIHWTVYTIIHFSSVLGAYIVAGSM